MKEDLFHEHLALCQKQAFFLSPHSMPSCLNMWVKIFCYALGIRPSSWTHTATFYPLLKCGLHGDKRFCQVYVVLHSHFLEQCQLLYMSSFGIQWNDQWWCSKLTKITAPFYRQAQWHFYRLSHLLKVMLVRSIPRSRSLPYLSLCAHRQNPSLSIPQPRLLPLSEVALCFRSLTLGSLSWPLIWNVSFPPPWHSSSF
jgi:hypothetical protein